MPKHDYSKNLTPESRTLYVKHIKLRILILGIGVAFYYAVGYFNAYQDRQDIVLARPQWILNLTLGLITAEWLYTFLKRETYYPLMRRDVAKGKKESAKILEDMKGIGNGKK